MTILYPINKPRNNSKMRWVTFLTLTFSIVVNYLCLHLLPANFSANLPAESDTLLFSQRFLFGIAGLICFSLFTYSLVQLLPQQYDKPLYDDLALPLTLTAIVSVVWICAFAYAFTLLSIIASYLLLLLSTGMFVRIKNARNRHRYSAGLSFPFSIYFGWIALATVIQMSAWLTQLNNSWHFAGRGLVDCTSVALLLIAVAIVSFHYRDALLPLVPATSMIMAFVQKRSDDPFLLLLSLLSGTILLALSAWVFVKRYSDNKKVPAYSGRAVMKIVR